MTAGPGLAEHDSPGDATLLVRRVEGEASWEGRAGEPLVIPPARHGLDAIEDSAVLLTVAKTG
ncbi:hypothetical protein ACFCXR_06970 [Streptomyces noursei]|uniref:hypothetical protein n=1 Tax=Streptomyces noursei TaxID=1971 RepID=UPI0035ABE237